ncbi:hypothetical protein H0H92_000844 [Tricholoma furcatifolium]|nr:hypothetical protein H0H92_000844 [Tricholoma furcatifolium]
MAWKSSALFTTCFFLAVHAQSISTNTPVPPLQWINLSPLLQGSSSPPPLKNAAIGYDETRHVHLKFTTLQAAHFTLIYWPTLSRSLIIFGGVSSTGIAQSQTYLLNLDGLTWSVPNPPSYLTQIPPARSAVISGLDSAASNRRGFLIAGGVGLDSDDLTDVWEFDFTNQFWSEVKISPGTPLPRWGACGGIDPTTAPIQDPVLPGPNNTFYLVGGYNGISPSSFSDVWRLNISGTLSSNLPNDTDGSWGHLTIGQLPSKYNASGTVVGHQIVVTGGCTSLSANGICAEQESYVIDTQQQTVATSSVCPAPRTGPVLVRNSNELTSTFSSQVFLLLGTLDITTWNDSGGLNNGEVAILDINTGAWSRILPSGDPGTSGNPTFPSPREGAAVISYPLALVGESRNASSDTLIFGGQDASGNFLSEIWLLRAYNGIIDSSAPTWSGYGNGTLQTGINANGEGVNITYMTECASEFSPTSTSIGTSTSAPSASASTRPSSTSHTTSSSFDTSVVHKALAPVSLAIYQGAFLVFRFASPTYKTGIPSVQAIYGSAVLLIFAFGLGAAAFATAFTSISLLNSSRQENVHLRTGHGIAGVILFSLLYVILPGVLFLHGYANRHRTVVLETENEKDNAAQTSSPEAYDWPSRSAPQSLHLVPSSPSSPRNRANSWGPSSMMHRSQEGRDSSDSDSRRSPSPKRGFEVTNRPTGRTRRTSSLAIPFGENSLDRLRDIDWLQRRRSLNAVGELDYTLTQVRREQLSTPATTDGLMAASTLNPSKPQPEHLTVSEMFIHIITQALLLGMAILTVVELWFRAPKAGFVVFLVWTVIFYAIMIILALRNRPDRAILSVLFHRQKSPAPLQSSTTPTRLAVLPELPPGPYVHQPSHRLATTADEVSLSQGGPQSTEADEPDDDLDDDTRQRIMEDEMGRRDVSIVTIPKRKLWVANP